jgi:hypothetical protein
MDNLFGMEITGAVRFLIAFVVVLALIGLTAWLVRRFGRGALASATGRGRQPRLAVIDAAAVDTRRKLVLVRRDNVEHLLLIGGPSDVVVEPNIVRAAPATREPPPLRATPALETPTRPAPREPEMTWPPIPEPGARLKRPASPMTARNPIAPPPTNGADRIPHLDIRPEPTDEIANQTPPHIEPAPPLEPDSEAAFAAPANDPHLAETAQKLETVTDHGPAMVTDHEPAPEEAMHDSSTVVPAVAPPVEVNAEHAEADQPDAQHPEIPEVRPPVPAEPHLRESKKLYETLEQEMASLLGRPTGKT